MSQLITRFTELASQEVVSHFMSTLERAEKVQRSSTNESDKRRGLSDEPDMGDILKQIGDVITDEKIKNVNEVEPLDKNIVASFQTLKEAIRKLGGNRQPISTEKGSHPSSLIKKRATFAPFSRTTSLSFSMSLLNWTRELYGSSVAV